MLENVGQHYQIRFRGNILEPIDRIAADEPDLRESTSSELDRFFGPVDADAEVIGSKRSDVSAGTATDIDNTGGTA